MTTTHLALLCALFAGTLNATDELRLEPYDYDYQGQRIHGEVGRFSVPERHADPGGRKITLAFLRLKSTSPQPGPPIFYLAGGPGGSGISLAKGPRGSLFLALREAGDVIALDQRGVGLSEPNLDCPGSLEFPLVSPGDFSPLLRRFEEASRACASFWRGRDVDLGAYNVVENAHDLDSLRQALGAERVILWGSSYGTHLGLAAIRHHGNHIFRAVLSGIEGPDQTLKLPSAVDEQLSAIGRLVGSDPVLARQIPDLVGLAKRVLAAAERTPFIISILDAESKPTAKVVLGRFDLEQQVIGMVGTREGLERLPGTLLAFDRGELSSPRVQQVARDVVEIRTGPIGSAMSYAMDCASSASKQRISAIRREMATASVGHLDFPIPEVCSAWNIPELPPSERTLVHSDVPVLFISGTLDGRTPPRNAEEIRKGFPKSSHILIEGAGHGNDLFVSSPEIQNVTLEFIKTGKVVINRIALPPLRFR